MLLDQFFLLSHFVFLLNKTLRLYGCFKS
uniref:Uncharacterized protein n=1 Tax=Rhizophora mucronata TaxID=61149 RepID=A0A2P2R369_RHIMU